MIALGTTLGVVALGVCAAFVLARYRFRGREVLYTFFTLGLLFPAGAAILPLYLHAARPRSDQLATTAVILPQVAFQLPVTIVILRPFLHGHPERAGGRRRDRRHEPARLLLAHPAAAVAARARHRRSARVRGELERVPAAAARPQRRSLHTLPLGVQNFSSQYTSDTAGILAFTSLAMLPALLFFTLAERQIVGGLQGAVKG